VAELEPMISALIKENRELHRQIDKLSTDVWTPRQERLK